MSLKNSNDTIGNRTRDLPVCSVVSLPLCNHAPPLNEISSTKIIKRTSLSPHVKYMTSLVIYWSELLATNHEVPGPIPGSTIGNFLEGGSSPW